MPASKYVTDMIEPIGDVENGGADHTDNLGDNPSSNVLQSNKTERRIEEEGLPIQVSTTQVQVHEKVKGMKKVLINKISK